MRALSDYICQQCGVCFQSRTKGKQFCSLSCYAKSPEGQQKLRRAAELGGAARKLGKGFLSVPCAECGKGLRVHPANGWKMRFCSKQCRRAYWHKLFDQFVANPELLPLPNNYDEFLDRDKLPCILPGCNWCGASLSGHLYQYHGITAEEFKELAGFNRSTGLIGKSTSERLAAFHMRQFFGGCPPVPEIGIGKYHPGLRPEGKEHIRKSRMNRRHSDETREKMREAWKRRKASVKIDTSRR